MNISWIGQSGYIINNNKTQIIIDPYLSDIVNKVANRPRLVDPPFSPKEMQADAIICTHDHLDHLDPETIAQTDKKDTIFIAPSSCVEKLTSLGCKNILPLDEGQKAKVGDFIIYAVFAKHSVDAIGVIISYKGINLYFTGDTLYDDRLKEIKSFNPDVMFICINGKLGNMDVTQAVQLTKQIDPKVGVPNHYGMFESNTEDPKKYTSKVKNSFIMEYNKFYSINELLKMEV